MNLNEFIDFANTKTQEGISMFGKYAFFDKGPDEVMNIYELTNKLREMSAEDAAKSLELLVNQKDPEGIYDRLASTLIVSMQDWDDLFDQEFIQNFDW